MFLGVMYFIMKILVLPLAPSSCSQLRKGVWSNSIECGGCFWEMVYLLFVVNILLLLAFAPPCCSSSPLLLLLLPLALAPPSLILWQRALLF